MPTYGYRCANGHEFEVFQRMSDEPVSACQECGAPVERVFHPVAVHFKGSGFYTTDYASASRSDGKPEPGKDSSADKGKGSGEKGKESGEKGKDSGERGKDSGEKAKAGSSDGD